MRSETLLDRDVVDGADRLDDALAVRGVDARDVTSRSLVPRSTRTRSIAPRIAPVSPIALATWPKAPGRCGRRTRIVMLYDADGCTIMDMSPLPPYFPRKTSSIACA